MKWFKRKHKLHVYRSYSPDTDPLTLAVNRAWNTGELVSWTEGEPLPDPGGPVRPIKDDPERQ